MAPRIPWPASFVTAVFLVLGLTVTVQAAIPAMFHFRNGRQRRGYFLYLRSDTVWVGIRKGDGTRIKRPIPKGHLVRVEFRNGRRLDLAASNFPAQRRPVTDTTVVARKVATIKIESSTFPGTVRIGGAELGPTPCTYDELKPGRYGIRIAGLGVVPIEDHVTVQAGEIHKRVYELKRTPEWLDSVAAVREDSLRDAARKKVLGAYMPQNVHGDLESLFQHLLAATPADVPMRIAVAPFAAGAESVSGEQAMDVAECAVRSLAWRPNLKVVEAARLEQAGKAMSLSWSDTISEEQMRKLGMVLSAQLILLGSVSDEAGTRLVSARIVAAETGDVLCAAAAMMDEEELERALADEIGESVRPPAAMLRSFVVPGWGQFYSGHPGHGTVSLLMVGGAAGALTWSLVDYHDKDERAALFATRDSSTMVEGETGEQWEVRADAALAQRNQASARTTVLIGATVGAWLLNVVDAALCSAMEAHGGDNRYFSARPSVAFGPKEWRLYLALDFRRPSR